ncbi:MAG: metal-sensitive transcriptional regulator [Chloroflexi bacterium]|nr:metal-sensitive transcriptional regulator [Chloroflexota bacterium]
MEEKVAPVVDGSAAKTTRNLQKRLKFIEGQARGVQSMIEAGRDPTDVLTQLIAIQAAARAAAEIIVRDRMVQQIRESLTRAVMNCADDCEVCEELRDVNHVLDRVDYSAVLEEAMRLRQNGFLSTNGKEALPVR